jgi:hypothetical protein
MSISNSKRRLKQMMTWTRNNCKKMARFFRDEDLVKTITQSFRANLFKSEKLMAYFFLVGALVMPILSAGINAFGQNYVTIHPWMLDGLLPGCAFCLFLCLKLREKFNYIGSVVTVFFSTAMLGIALASGATSILPTPFGQNDLSHAIYQFDVWLGFNQAALMNWRAHLPNLTHWLEFSYMSITQQVAFTGLILAAFHCFKSARLYLLVILVGSLIAYIIYYFFPTFAPNFIIHNAVFPETAAQLLQRTIGIREHIPYKLYPGAGLIAFPSCHVLMALTGIFCWIAAIKEAKKAWIKCVCLGISLLIIVINLSLIAATILLGYHYLADVIASVILFLGAWFFLYPILKKEKA